MNNRMPNVETFELTLGNELGSVRARAIMRIAEERYEELHAARKHYQNRALRRHLEANILPGVALYKALSADGETSARAEELLEAAFIDWGKSSRRKMERIARWPIYYGLMRAIVRLMMRINFPVEGWETEWVEVSGRAIAFNMKSCFYREVLGDYGHPQLTALYCRLDDLIYEGLSPHVKWVRRKTLGRGDDCCDFRFERVK